MSACARSSAAAIYDAIAVHKADHFCAAPTVMGMLVNAREDERRPLPGSVRVLTAGSPPPAAMLEAAAALGFKVDHVYGITEVSGTPVSCAWQPAWDDLDPTDQGRLQARQGVRAAVLEGLTVVDAQTMRPVPHDGRTSGELVVRGNTIMMGYLKNPDSTQRAF